MTNTDEKVTLSAGSLSTLMSKCQSLGWEVANGHHTEATANEQRARLFREFTGVLEP